MGSTPIKVGDQQLLLGAAFSSYFTYIGLASIPYLSGLGVGFPLPLQAAIAAALGAFIGISISVFAYNEVPSGGFWTDWFGPHGRIDRQLVLNAAIVAALACLIFPDNNAVQAAAVLIKTVTHNWSSWGAW